MSMLSSIKRAGGIIVAAFTIMSVFQAAPAGAFDFDNGKAPVEVVVPTVLPFIEASISPSGSDASLVLRITSTVSNSWFDAIAPYHPTAVGVYSHLGRRPVSESITNRNKNIAIIYASYRVLNSLFPQQRERWRTMLTSVGLDPDDNQENTVTPIGIGNMAGKAVAAAKERDGFNQLGDIGCKYNCQPYADYTGYEPVNTAYDLRDPSRWQPSVGTRGNGIFQVQQGVTPQWRLVRPYSYDNPNRFRAPVPHNSNHHNREAYRQQADEVLAASAALTDHQKMTAELFNHKLRSLGFAEQFIARSRGFNLDQTVQFVFMNNVAAWDGGIAAWNEKYRYDAVRPFSAIRYLYGDRPVTAWGGPGKGTVSDLPAAEWRSYLNVADHPEYPSGSACFCGAHAQASRRYLGSDAFGWSVPVARGSSRVEPGITPATDIVLGPWNTYTEFENDCAMSRVWGGVHFKAAVIEGLKQCRPIGDTAYEFVRAHIEGNVQ